MSFDRAMKFLMKWEGGYVNHPKDPGGETKYGISKRSYPRLDIKNLTTKQAREIYKQDYWNRCGCDNIPEPLDMVVFDTAVNCGASRALKWYSFVKGKRIMEAVKHYLTLRQNYYGDIVKIRPKMSAFHKGWMNRLQSLTIETRVYFNEKHTQVDR